MKCFAPLKLQNSGQYCYVNPAHVACVMPMWDGKEIVGSTVSMAVSLDGDLWEFSVAIPPDSVIALLEDAMIEAEGGI